MPRATCAISRPVRPGSLNASGETVRPGLAGHVVLNQETGTAFAGKTGTADGNCWLRDGARAH